MRMQACRKNYLFAGSHEAAQNEIRYEDKRAALMKLSDRLHNMPTIKGHPL